MNLHDETVRELDELLAQVKVYQSLPDPVVGTVQCLSFHSLRSHLYTFLMDTKLRHLKELEQKEYTTEQRVLADIEKFK